MCGPGCYSPLVYYLSKFLEEAILCGLTTTLFGMIVFWGLNLQVRLSKA